MAAFLAPRRLLVELGRPALPLAARDRRDRVDRLVVLLHRARPPPGAARRRAGRRARRRRRGVGDPRRRLLPVEKFKVAPETLPDPLYWFKWEAYTTWLSGLRAPRASSTSRTPRRSSSTSRSPTSRAPRRSLLAIGGLVIAWLVYDALCRLLDRNDTALAIVVAGLRRARRLGRVAALRAARRLHRGRRDARDDHGRERLLRDHPDALEARPREGGRRGARPGAGTPRGKQRSVHNNYFTLPVVFAMLSNHFPFTYGHAPRLADPRRADGARRAGPPLLQPPPPRPERLVDPGHRRGRAASRSRSLIRPASSALERGRARPRASPRCRRSSRTAARPATR